MQAVEKPQVSARGSQPIRTSIVVGGVHGNHGADFALQNALSEIDPERIAAPAQC